MEVFARTSSEYYLKEAKMYLELLDATNDPNEYAYYYEEAIWWLYLYNEANNGFKRSI